METCDRYESIFPNDGYTFEPKNTPWFVFLQPIVPLFEMIESIEALSRDSRAPPKNVYSDLEKGGLIG